MEWGALGAALVGGVMTMAAQWVIGVRSDRTARQQRAHEGLRELSGRLMRETEAKFQAYVKREDANWQLSQAGSADEGLITGWRKACDEYEPLARAARQTLVELRIECPGLGVQADSLWTAAETWKPTEAEQSRQAFCVAQEDFARAVRSRLEMLGG